MSTGPSAPDEAGLLAQALRAQWVFRNASWPAAAPSCGLQVLGPTAQLEFGGWDCWSLSATAGLQHLQGDFPGGRGLSHGPFRSERSHRTRPAVAVSVLGSGGLSALFSQGLPVALHWAWAFLSSDPGQKAQPVTFRHEARCPTRPLTCSSTSLSPRRGSSPCTPLGEERRLSTWL